MSLLWNFAQDQRLRETSAEASQALDSAQSQQRALDELKQRVETLSLTCQAFWEMARERGGWTDDQLLEKMQELDVLDGKRDGRLGPVPLTCSSCQRKNNTRRAKCLYCGQPLVGGPLFGRG